MCYHISVYRVMLIGRDLKYFKFLFSCHPLDGNSSCLMWTGVRVTVVIVHHQCTVAALPAAWANPGLQTPKVNTQDR